MCLISVIINIQSTALQTFLTCIIILIINLSVLNFCLKRSRPLIHLLVASSGVGTWNYICWCPFCDSGDFQFRFAVSFSFSLSAMDCPHWFHLRVLLKLPHLLNYHFKFNLFKSEIFLVSEKGSKIATKSFCILAFVYKY